MTTPTDEQVQTRREIIDTYPTYDGSRWSVTYQVWGHNGQDLGTWHRYVHAPDAGGAALAMIPIWAKADRRNEKRRALAKRKLEEQQHAD